VKPDRLVRVNRLLQEALAEVVPHVKDPDVARAALVSITGVKTTPDLRHARVFLAVTGERAAQEAALRGLERARGFLRAALAKSGVRLRYLPELHFVLDETMETASRVEQILRELAREGDHLDQPQQQGADVPRPGEEGAGEGGEDRDDADRAGDDGAGGEDESGASAPLATSVTSLGDVDVDVDPGAAPAADGRGPATR